MSHHNRGMIGDSKILQRKIPARTTRYNDIRPRVDTGSSMTRYQKRIEDMQTNYRFKKDELFRRLKSTTLAQLILQVANVSMQEEDASISDLASAQSQATTASLNGDDRGSIPDTRNGLHDDMELSSPRSSLQSVIRGMGEVDVIDKNKPRDFRPETPFLEKPYPDCPYILLDVRDQYEFEACHIVGAKNFPIAMLSRTMNNFTKEILEYKNVVGRIIILYDEDERLATVAATTMVERGFDNIFILSGGLKVLGQKFPDGIVTGTYPVNCCIAASTRKSRDYQQSASLGLPADPRKLRFSSEDLDKINHYLDESLVPQDTGSRLSRLTNTSRHTNTSKASSVATGISSRRAWR
ncbi:unnamed protein product [Clavelina lepadiformis]|uniref:Rhodanese domain-containing protein n=1 Tax=Clavelina lepadiformis TaxID=159417 RepID=A0ABP0GC40_CLALP